MLGYVGRLSSEKGLGLLLRALRLVVGLEPIPDEAQARWRSLRPVAPVGGAREAPPSLPFVRAHSAVQLRVVGGGSQRTALEESVARLGLASWVRFEGPLFGAALEEAFEAMDILVFPSLRPESETFGVVNVEAMAMELPLVTFGTGGACWDSAPPIASSPLSP